MTIEQIKKRGSRTKHIHNYWCWFCRIEVEHKEAIVVPTFNRRYFNYLCPRCGGRLLGDAPGVRRDIFTVKM